jgi:hypothetical protein
MQQERGNGKDNRWVIFSTRLQDIAGDNFARTILSVQGVKKRFWPGFSRPCEPRLVCT